jgi:hypothetical protein
MALKIELFTSYVQHGLADNMETNLLVPIFLISTYVIPTGKLKFLATTDIELSARVDTPGPAGVQMNIMSDFRVICGEYIQVQGVGSEKLT